MINKVDRRLVLLAVSISSFLTPFMGSSVNVALPSIARQYSMTATLQSWVATSYLVAAAMALLPWGRYADIVGRKKVFLWGTVVYMISSALLAVSPSAVWVIVFRVIQGFSGGMTFGTAVAILTSVYPPQERGRVLGINIGVVYFGLSIGPVLGGILTQHFGWPSIFIFNVPLCLAVLIPLMRLKGDWAESHGQTFDITGSLVYALSLLAIMYGLSVLPDLLGAYLIAAGIAGLLIFVWWESRVAHPLLNIRLFRRNTVFIMSNLTAMISYSATFAIAFLMSQYLQYIKEYDPQTAGFILIAQPAMQALFSPLMGRLSDRIQPRWLTSIGMSLNFIGLLALAFVGKDTSVIYIIIWLVVVGLGFAFFSSPNTNAVMSSVDRRYYGVASSALGTARLVGQMFSLGLASLMFALYIGHVQIVEANYPQFLEATHTAFIIFAALCFIGIFASLARGKLERDNGEIKPS